MCIRDRRKLDALEDLIEAATGKPLLVAYWYRHDLERIRERFGARPIATARDIADWNAGKIAVGLIHPASAGHGLNLQEGGSTLIWFTPTWSLEPVSYTHLDVYKRQGICHGPGGCGLSPAGGGAGTRDDARAGGVHPRK